jgi:hypothetical protein
VTFRLLGGTRSAERRERPGAEGRARIVPIVLLVAGLLGWAIHRSPAGWDSRWPWSAAYVLGAYGLLPARGPHADRPFKTGAQRGADP